MASQALSERCVELVPTTQSRAELNVTPATPWLSQSCLAAFGPHWSSWSTLYDWQLGGYCTVAVDVTSGYCKIKIGIPESKCHWYWAHSNVAFARCSAGPVSCWVRSKPHIRVDNAVLIRGAASVKRRGMPRTRCLPSLAFVLLGVLQPGQADGDLHSEAVALNTKVPLADPMTHPPPSNIL
jgi:hypothetical protein